MKPHNRHLERKLKFTCKKDIPNQYEVRKTKIQYVPFLGFLIIIIYFVYRINHSEQAHKVAIGILVLSIYLFGILIKLALGYIFPEVILNDKGVKLIGRKIILWNEIDKIKTKPVIFDTKIVITTYNGKKITESFKDLNLTTYEFRSLIRGFHRKYNKNKSKFYKFKTKIS